MALDHFHERAWTWLRIGRVVVDDEATAYTI
jgi:hypothetical protein